MFKYLLAVSIALGATTAMANDGGPTVGGHFTCREWKDVFLTIGKYQAANMAIEKLTDLVILEELNLDMTEDKKYGDKMRKLIQTPDGVQGFIEDVGEITCEDNDNMTIRDAVHKAYVTIRNAKLHLNT